MSVQIVPVRGFADLRRFVALPYRLHAGTPWVPPLRLERYIFLNRRLNAFFTHGEAQYFLAGRDGRVVGRVSAHIDHAFNDFHASRWGLFGFLEFEDDQEVVDALLAAAQGWLAQRGCDRMVGPMDFVINDESGIVVEGFARDPLIRNPWQPPYYAQRVEEAGLVKAMDLLMWELDISDRERLHPILPKLAERARTRHGIRIRRMSRRRLRRDLDEFARVYNAAWSRNWGFVPYSDKDLDAYALDLQLVFDRDWFMIAENDTETVAMAITIPDINQVLKRMNGHVLPTGWWHYVNRRRIVDRLRVGFLGVMPEYQHTGAAAALYLEHFDTAVHSRCKRGETGWILESNTSMNRGMEAMGGRVVKRYRCYERRLGPVRPPDPAPAA